MLALVAPPPPKPPRRPRCTCETSSGTCLRTIASTWRMTRSVASSVVPEGMLMLMRKLLLSSLGAYSKPISRWV